jgi:hypothetical protein
MIGKKYTSAYASNFGHLEGIFRHYWALLGAFWKFWPFLVHFWGFLGMFSASYLLVFGRLAVIVGHNWA